MRRSCSSMYVRYVIQYTLSCFIPPIVQICGIVDTRTTLLMIIRKRVCVDCYGARRKSVIDSLVLLAVTLTPHRLSFVSTNMLLTLLGHKFAGIVEDLLLPVTPDEHSDLGRSEQTYVALHYEGLTYRPSASAQGISL
jgi:hypothetical protein